MFKHCLLILAALLLIAGCSNENAGNGNNGGNSAEPPAAAEPAVRQGEQSDQQEEPNEQIDDTTVMNAFKELAKGEAGAAELLSFLSRHRDKVSKDNLSSMLIALEEAQDEESAALEERFYSEYGMQEKLMEWYGDGKNPARADTVKDEALCKLLTDTEAGGYKVDAAEGTFYPVIDYERYREFQPNVTTDMGAYIGIMAAESNAPALKDAALVIGWDELVERALSMERFIGEYPDSAKLEAVKQLFDGYTYVTFKGIDNTPLFGYEDGVLAAEAKKAFADAVSSGTDGSGYLQKIDKFLQLARKNGDMQTEEIVKFQEEAMKGTVEE